MSVAGAVIEANARPEFEDGLRIRSSFLEVADSYSVRTQKLSGFHQLKPRNESRKTETFKNSLCCTMASMNESRKTENSNPLPEPLALNHNCK